LQIEGNWGCYLGTQPMGGGGRGVERRRTGPYISISVTDCSLSVPEFIDVC
jgi:hypothetical protein